MEEFKFTPSMPKLIVVFDNDVCIRRSQNRKAKKLIDGKGYRLKSIDDDCARVLAAHADGAYSFHDIVYDDFKNYRAVNIKDLKGDKIIDIRFVYGFLFTIPAFILGWFL